MSEEEEKKIPANQHPAYLKLLSELQSKGMTVESEIPANAADCKAVSSGAFFIYAGDNDWETDPDRFNDLVNRVDPAKHRCSIEAWWSSLNPGLLFLSYDAWKDAGVE